jgi:hypothetical protein
MRIIIEVENVGRIEQLVQNKTVIFVQKYDLHSDWEPIPSQSLKNSIFLKKKINLM